MGNTTQVEIIMAKRQERQWNAIRQVIRHATICEIFHGVEMLEGAKLIEGDTIIQHYATCPNALAGIAYTAGIAEGKRRERDRRRQAKEAAQAAQLAAKG